MVSPVRGDHRRFQAETPLIDLFKFAEPALVLPVAALAYAAILVADGTIDASSDFGLLRCFAGFATGVFLSNHSSGVREMEARKIVALSLAVSVALLASLSSSFQYWEVITLPCFAATILLVSRDVGPVAALLNSGPIAYLGRISYSVYMVHFPVLVVFYILTKRFVNPLSPESGNNLLLSVGVGFGTSIVGIATIAILVTAHAMYKIVEAPGRELGRRIAISVERPQLIK